MCHVALVTCTAIPLYFFCESCLPFSASCPLQDNFSFSENCENSGKEDEAEAGAAAHRHHHHLLLVGAYGLCRKRAECRRGNL